MESLTSIPTGLATAEDMGMIPRPHHYTSNDELFPPHNLFELQEQGAEQTVASEESPIRHIQKIKILKPKREKVMARDTAEFAQQSSERAMQAANFGMNWGREFAEVSFNQS